MPGPRWPATALVAPASAVPGGRPVLDKHHLSAPTRPSRRPKPHPVLLWLSGLLLAYLAVPVAVFLVRSAGAPGQGFGAPGLWGAVATSAQAATISAGLVAVLGVPLAYLLARSNSRLASAAGLVVQLPLALPPLMSGVVLLYVFGPGTWLGRLTGGWFTESLAGIVLAQCFVASPFLIVAARSAFRAVEANFEDIAATAGMGPLERFYRVAVPVAAGGIRAGLVLTWLRAFGEYGATVMLAYHPYSLPVFTYVQFSAVGLPATQAPALIGLALAAIVVAASRAPHALWPRPGRRAGTGRLPQPSPGGAGPAEGKRPVSRPRPAPAASPVPVAFDVRSHKGSFTLDVAYRARTHRLAVLGPSGAGKSLTLRALGGLAPGRVWFGDDDVGGLPAESRGAGYVPQGPNLLPHLNAWSNMALGPRCVPGLIEQWASVLGIVSLYDRRPHQLSGGQAQRVAIARALSSAPRVVLLDEPFTGLDAPVRAALVQQLRRLQVEGDLSTVLVTHDFREAALLADEVVVISHGRVLQAGSVGEVARRPCSPEVAALTGARNLVAGTSAGPGAVEVAPGQVLTTPHHGLRAGTALTWCARPELLELVTGPVGHGPLGTNVMEGHVLDVVDLGPWHEVLIGLGRRSEPQLSTATRGGAPPGIGDEVWLHVDPDQVMVWPGAPGRAAPQ